MANTTVTLIKGLKIGESVHLEAELREATVADMVDGASDAERVVATPDGYQLVASPTRTSLEVLRRQIVRIGDHQGPLSLAELKMLSAKDLELLNLAADGLEQATVRAVEERGRDQASSE